MISTKKAYAAWLKTYDTNKNRTRDLELTIGQKILGNFTFKKILEIGCGTGKNTEWLLKKTEQIISVDLSPEMLEIAKEKVISPKVKFIEADIKQAWDFAESKADLITFSLILEHIEDLKPIFDQAIKCLAPGGKIYICEWHAYKQLAGSQARFESETRTVLVESYAHHVSEFWNLATDNGLTVCHLGEWFDDEEGKLPRLISLVLTREPSPFVNSL